MERLSPDPFSPASETNDARSRPRVTEGEAVERAGAAEARVRP